MAPLPHPHPLLAHNPILAVVAAASAASHRYEGSFCCYARSFSTSSRPPALCGLLLRGRAALLSLKVATADNLNAWSLETFFDRAFTLRLLALVRARIVAEHVASAFQTD